MMKPNRQARPWAIPVFMLVAVIIPAIMRHALPHSGDETYCEIAIILVGMVGLGIYVSRVYRSERQRS